MLTCLIILFIANLVNEPAEVQELCYSLECQLAYCQIQDHLHFDHLHIDNLYIISGD